MIAAERHSATTDGMTRMEREDVRRSQLIEATIATMSEVGFSATGSSRIISATRTG